MTQGAEAFEVDSVLNAIAERYGYDFRGYTRASITRRVLSAQARFGAKHLPELAERILDDPSLFASVLSALTVQVTELFRDPGFFLAFREHVVPKLRTYPEVKLWHAGCATGEEAYSMAILMDEEGLYERCVIYGTDLDETAIARAKCGVYSERQTELFTTNHALAGGRGPLSSYCTHGYGRLALAEALRKNVVFFQHDLATDFSLGEMQVVCCRNVALYFDTALRNRVFAVFADSLVTGGFLCLGASEALPLGLQSSFDVLSSEHRIFRKKGAR